MSEIQLIEAVIAAVHDAEREHRDVIDERERHVLVITSVRDELRSMGIVLMAQRTGDETL